MFRKVSLLVFTVLSLFIIPATFAQEDASEGTNALPFNIESVTASSIDSNIMLDVVATWPTGCQGLPVVLTQTVDRDRITVELTQEVAPLQPCPMMLRFFEGQILIAGDFAPGLYTVDLNGTTAEVQVGDPSEATPFPEVAIPANGPAMPIQVDEVFSIATMSIPAQVRVSVSGTLPTGCTGFPIEISQRIEDDTVAITINQITAENAACIAMLVPYQVLIPLWGAFDTIPTVTVNGVAETGASDGETQTGTDTRMPIFVENVLPLTTRSIPAQIVLFVTGTLQTGCADLPIEVTQARDGANVNVEIVQIVPENQACPMMIVPYEEHIRLDGDFWGDTFNITVNGFAVEPLPLGVE